MRVTNNENSQSRNTVSINIVDENRQNSVLSNKRRKGDKVSGKSIFAGNLNILSQQDILASKHVKNQKKALKGVLDQFKKDMDIDNNLASRRRNITTFEEEAGIARKELDKVQKLRQNLKDSYNITEDSEQEKELQLLRKSMDPFSTLTEDEKIQLSNIGKLTEYQKSALEYYTMEDVWQERFDNASKGMVNEGQSIIAIKLELLKSHPMTDAQKEAAKIMEAANKEVLATILQQAKEHIDEKMEEEKEAAKKQAEELDEKKIKDKDPSVEKTRKDMNEIQEFDSEQEKMHTELKHVIEKMNVIEEDLKGIVVDKFK